jgi:hypothetical protein
MESSKKLKDLKTGKKLEIKGYTKFRSKNSNTNIIASDKSVPTIQSQLVSNLKKILAQKSEKENLDLVIENCKFLSSSNFKSLVEIKILSPSLSQEFKSNFFFNHTLSPDLSMKFHLKLCKDSSYASFTRWIDNLITIVWSAIIEDHSKSNIDENWTEV